MKPLYRNFPSILRAGALLPLLAVMLASPPAEAFCRTTTAVATDRNDLGCSTEGKALYHPLAKFSYRIVPSEPTIPTAVLTEKMAKAFAHWTAKNARCTPGIAVEVLPPATRPVPIVGFEMTGKGENWNNIGVSTDPTIGRGGELALATLHFNQNTGAILDADLAIDTKPKWSFTDEAPPDDGIDLEAVLTHDAGHILGLAHSAVPTSVMFPTYTPGSITARTLDADDIEAICTIYPTAGQRLSATGLVPTLTCGSPSEDPAKNCSVPSSESSDGGCSAAPGRSRGLVLPGIALAMGVAAAVRRRRARRG